MVILAISGKMAKSDIKLFINIETKVVDVGFYCCGKVALPARMKLD